MRTHVLALAASALALTAAVPAAQARASDLAWAPGVQWIYELISAPAQYRADRRIEVRSDPKADSLTTMILHRGDLFEAAGRTEDGWVAVMQDGMIQGYVNEGLVSPMTRMRYASR